jgi:hypothetical protein
LPPNKAGQRPADTARIDAGKAGIGDDRLGPFGQPLVGLDGLAPPFLLTAIPAEQADAKADRILQGTEPIPTGKWTGRRRCCKMFHGVSSFRRLHTVFLNVLQSGIYADSPIFHQPCDTTELVVIRHR